MWTHPRHDEFHVSPAANSETNDARLQLWIQMISTRPDATIQLMETKGEYSKSHSRDGIKKKNKMIIIEINV